MLSRFVIALLGKTGLGHFCPPRAPSSSSHAFTPAPHRPSLLPRTVGLACGQGLGIGLISLGRQTQEALLAPSPIGTPWILVPSGGAVSREPLGFADIHDYQSEGPAHSSAPAGVPEERWRPLEERLERLEAEVTELREQVPLKAVGVQGAGQAWCSGKKGGKGSLWDPEIEFCFKST